ncbi:LuxR C-terminal-related transcriptional regulator [Streptomyces sp. CA-132043]|uniref:LuxR C-terminal-related transcriptional regulator n=1 Tax=Streptomyces sp. CA-132043 TaxID=3240048 RepID=UPI003D903382
MHAGPTTDLVDGPVPARVSALVRSLTRGCSETCRRMVSVAAVLGRRIVFEELAHVLGVAPSDLLTATEEATAAGLMSAEGRDLAFASELLWRVVYESVPPTVRSALRQQAAPHGSRHVDPAGPAGRPESRRMPTTRHVLRAAHRRTHPAGRLSAGSVRLPAPPVRADHSRALVTGAEPVVTPTAAPLPTVRADPETADGVPSVATARVSPARAGAWDALNERQRAIVRLVIHGLTNRQIADKVHLSPHTVNYHLRRIYQEFGIGSRLGLLGIAHVHGLP